MNLSTSLVCCSVYVRKYITKFKSNTKYYYSVIYVKQIIVYSSVYICRRKTTSPLGDIYVTAIFKGKLPLYDVTSSYLEGANNELADYGYNRDKKKGKKQIVIGLLTNSEGMPVAVRVFKGNTSDSKTIPDQISLLRNDFLIKKVTLVGDRAMFPQAQKDDLPEQISYISAIGKRQIKTLLKNEQLQMSLFDEDLQEVEIDQVRYILRCNSHRKQELADNRADKIKFISTKIEEKNTYLQEHPRSSTDVALKPKLERF